MPAGLEQTIYGIVVVVIGLIVEYWIIQPLSNKQKSERNTQSNRKANELSMKLLRVFRVSVAAVVVFFGGFVLLTIIGNFLTVPSAATPMPVRVRIPISQGMTINGTVSSRDYREYSYKPSNSEITTVSVASPNRRFYPIIDLYDLDGKRISSQADSTAIYSPEGALDFKENVTVMRLAPEPGVEYVIRVRPGDLLEGGSYTISLATAH